MLLTTLAQVRKSAAADLLQTVMRWRELDPRLIVGLFAAVSVVSMRIGALFIDIDRIPVNEVRRVVGSRFGASSVMASPNCAAVEGWLLGSDRNARPLAMSLVEATEAFFEPALLSCAIAMILGTLLGALAGYFRGSLLDSVTKLLLTVVASYPRLILVIVAVGIFVSTLHDPGGALKLRMLMVATFLGFAYVPVLAFAVYQKVSAFQREQFVEAARAHGLGHVRILGYHILWANCLPVVARHFFYLFGYFILVETSLSFLGGNYGVPASVPSWGNLVTGCDLGSLLAPAFVAPAVCIVGSILGLTMLGDGIGDRFERRRG
jgi:peptide/nickel transport system permease protein